MIMNVITLYIVRAIHSKLKELMKRSQNHNSLKHFSKLEAFFRFSGIRTCALDSSIQVKKKKKKTIKITSLGIITWMKSFELK